MGYSIYKINFPNGKYYIGQTSKSVQQRFIEHCWDRTNSNLPLHRPIIFAMKKYKNQVNYTILAENLTSDEADSLEKYYIKYYNSLIDQNGYNISHGGRSGSIMSTAGKNRHNAKMRKHYDNPEYIKKISEGQLRVRDKDPISHSKRMSKIINDYHSNPDNSLKHKEITSLANKQRSSRLKRSKSKGGKQFYCIETGQVFLMLQDAAEVFGVDKRSIHKCLKYPNRSKTILRKYRFKYL